MKSLKIDTPEEFWKQIPRTLPENIEFRKQIHRILSEDKEAQKSFLNMCYLKPQIAFDTCFWTYNPKAKAFMRNLPFILRPEQIKAVDEVIKAIREGYDLLVEKSRDEGATEIFCKIFALEFLLVPESSFLCGSRKDEYVDHSTSLVEGTNRVAGSPKCIFHKILYTFATCPVWMKPRLHKSHNHLENLENGSVIDGEATNENFGAGDRRTAILLDEFGRVEHRLAQSIRESVNDVSDCILYNSTHFYGRGHPFAKLRFSNKVKVVLLPWYKNPEKSKGIYKSPDINKIKLIDTNYYSKRYPKVFKGEEDITYSDIEQLMFIHYPEAKLNFIADGIDKFRSPWYDSQEKRRDPRDMAQNIDMNPVGSTENFFDLQVCQILRTNFVRKPSVVGEVEFTITKQKKLSGIKFKRNGGRKRLLLWVDLINGRLNQDHNYIVACDVSLGTGASNSVAGIYDANTRERVGIFATPDLTPSDFADQVIAICHWVGGKSHKPYLIWEGNGPGGAFYKRVKLHQYTFIYYNRKQRDKRRKRSTKPGWYSNKEAKYDLLLDLRVALHESVKTTPIGKYLIIYDEESISEYEDYMFYENGDIGLSTCIDESSGAKSAHGDRVITDGLAVIAMGEVGKAAVIEISTKHTSNTMAYRRMLYLRDMKRKERNSLWEI